MNSTEHHQAVEGHPFPPCCRKPDDADQAGSKRQKQADPQADLQFGRLDMGQAGQLGKQQPRKKKPSKEQLLQDALQKQKQKSDSSDAQVLTIAVHPGSDSTDS